jgi:hypothetical protein
MLSDETHQRSSEERPPWWKIGGASVAGVGAGGVLYLVLLWLITLLLDLLIGRSSWQEILRDVPDAVRPIFIISFWIAPLALGQFFSVVFSGWAKSVYFAALLQALNLAAIFSTVELFYLWLLPLLLAFATIHTGWISAAQSRARVLEAKRKTLL